MRVAFLLLLASCGGVVYGDDDADSVDAADTAIIPDNDTAESAFEAADVVDVTEAETESADTRDVAEAETEVEAEVGTDSAEVTPDVESCTGWRDPTSLICWQDPPSEALYTAPEAAAYCVANGWRLPTIDELRTLIRGCPATELGGECGVTDECPTCNSGACNSCYGDMVTPFWPPELHGTIGWYWTSIRTPVGYGIVSFYCGTLGVLGPDSPNHARCVLDS